VALSTKKLFAYRNIIGFIMRIWEILLVLALILPASAQAVEEKLSMGPYVVTFDADIEKQEWDITAQESETYDGSPYVGYDANGGLIKIGIFEYNLTKGDSLITANEWGKVVEEGQAGGATPKIYSRKIDEKDGCFLITTILGDTVYVAYWLHSNNTSVMLISFLPWDEGTLQLLKTIHVERIPTTPKYRL